MLQALQFDSWQFPKLIFALQLLQLQFWKAKTGAFRPHESFFDEGQTKENEDEDNFF